MTIHFRPSDPLKLLTQEVVFSREKKEDDEKQDEEEEKNDRERLLEIWKSFSRFDTAPQSEKPLVLKKTLLKAIAKKLNSNVMQDEIYEKFLQAQKGSTQDRKECDLLIKNLELINAKIDQVNNSWFKKIFGKKPIPLVERIFNAIERVRVPAPKSSSSQHDL